MRDKICNAIAGIIGNYTYCTSSTKSIGTFKSNNSANPYIGEKKFRICGRRKIRSCM